MVLGLGQFDIKLKIVFTTKVIKANTVVENKLTTLVSNFLSVTIHVTCNAVAERDDKEMKEPLPFPVIGCGKIKSGLLIAIGVRVTGVQRCENNRISSTYTYVC